MENFSKIYRPEGGGQTRIGCDVCQNFTWISDKEDGILVRKEILEKILNEVQTPELRSEIEKILKG